MENEKKSLTARREFLKKACKTTGYVLPAVAALKLGSAKAWAQSYGRNLDGEPRGKGVGFFERVVRAIEGLFHN